MSLVSKPTELRELVLAKKAKEMRGSKLIEDFTEHYTAINAIDYFNVKEVEEILLKEQEHLVEVSGRYPGYPKGLARFSPSSSDKCERELFFKAIKAKKDEETGVPFQRRWTRNSSAVHGAVQKQLLEAEFLLKDPLFKVMRLEDSGLPAWEHNIEKWKIFEVNGTKFVVFGMCDGILEHKDGSKIGFEFKTKSNSVAQIKQIKEPQIPHKWQTVAYSLLFDVDEWLIVYESVAKDKWSTGENARPDFKVFYNKVTQQDKDTLLKRWARVAEDSYNGEVSRPDYHKCLFCPFKNVCNQVGD